MRTFYNERDLHSHLLRRQSEEKQIERAIEQLTLNKTLFEDVKIKMDKMEKILEIRTNDSRLKDVVEKEVERLREASECFKKNIKKLHN